MITDGLQTPVFGLRSILSNAYAGMMGRGLKSILGRFSGEIHMEGKKGARVERQKWTREDIERELCLYRENRCIRDQLGLDVEALRDYVEQCRDEAIEGGALKSPQEPDMPRSNTIANPTARLAVRIDEEAELAALTIKWRNYDRRVRRVEAWLAALTHRERTLLNALYVAGASWEDVVFKSGNYLRSREPRGESTLYRWRRQAIKKIEKITNSPK